MPFFSLSYRDQAQSQSIPIALAGVSSELESLVNRLSSWASIEHNEDGTHNTLPSGYGFVPIGGMIQWPSGVTVPSKWIKADGSSVSRTQYALLFKVYGTTIGVGDGSTTFTLPTQSGFILLAGA